MLTLITFITCYALFAIFGSWRAVIAVTGALLLLFSGVVNLHQAVTELIYWNVVALFLGTVILAEIFMQSRMPAVIAEWFVDKAPTARSAIIIVCLLSSFLSAFVENVAVVLIVAPITITLCNKVGISPVRPIIFLAMFSNVQGTATLIGDPPSMILGGYMKMGFNDFFFYQGKLSIFFIVQVGAIAATFFVAWILRDIKSPISLIPVETPRSYIPSLTLIFFVIGLAFGSKFDPDFKWFAGTYALFLAVVLSIWYELKARWTTFSILLRQLDWDTTFFLTGLFILVGALKKAGWIDMLSFHLAQILDHDLAITFIAIIVISIVISAFVDNVPYLLTMIPVVQNIADTQGHPITLLVFALLVGSCLGGNITPIGATANIVAVGILQKEGHPISFGRFVKYGLPFTLIAVTASGLTLWFIWS
ncbi:MAG: SLC13 family permease [Chlamydiales bacterium]